MRSQNCLPSFALMILLFGLGCARPLATSGDPHLFLNQTSRQDLTTSILDQGQNQYMQVSSLSLGLQDVRLERDPQGCFSSEASTKNDFDYLRICQSSAQVSLNLVTRDQTGKGKSPPQQRRLVLKGSPAPLLPNQVTLETPRAYTLDELRQLTKAQSFTSLEEFHRYQAARANMRLHALNLLPHISFNSGFSLITSAGILGLIGSIGDFLPFLLPNRWFQAGEADHAAKAEQESLTIARDDAVQMMEGFALLYTRDHLSEQSLKQTRERYAFVVDQIKKLEDQNKLPKGRYRDVASPINLLDQAIATLHDIQDSELTEIGSAAGFINPLAVKDVTTKSLPEFKNLKPLALSALEQATLQTARETLQLDELIKAAQLNKKGRLFEWLDPAGDPQAGLGLGLASYIEIAKANVELLRVQRTHSDSDLLKKISEAADDYNDNPKEYAIAAQGEKIQTQRLQTAIDELTAAPNDTPVGEIQDALSQLATAQLLEFTTEYAAYNALSRIQRLTHTGIYAPSAGPKK